ncbi:MAG: hypothetical protein HY606_10715 [Planctomycetes bacterium]|nr:hypothetical protein [Planctomycetota bacterium]
MPEADVKAAEEQLMDEDPKMRADALARQKATKYVLKIQNGKQSHLHAFAEEEQQNKIKVSDLVKWCIERWEFSDKNRRIDKYEEWEKAREEQDELNEPCLH